MTSPATAPGISFFSSTLATILVVAIEHNGVLGAGFHNVALPAANERARFLEYKSQVFKYLGYKCEREVGI